MLYLFQLDNLMEYLEGHNPGFLDEEEIATNTLLNILVNKLNTHYAIPCELSYPAVYQTNIWNTWMELAIDRDIRRIIYLLREATSNDFGIRFKVVENWLYGIEVYRDFK